MKIYFIGKSHPFQFSNTINANVLNIRYFAMHYVETLNTSEFENNFPLSCFIFEL